MKPKRPVLGGHESVRICVAQISPAYMNRDACVTRACEAIRSAGQGGAQLIVFPETWIAGYPYWTEGWDSALPDWAAARIRFMDEAVVAPSAVTEALGRAAREANIYVVVGCNELDPRPEVQTIYNSLLIFSRDGTLLGRHRKLMPTFTERMFWGHGEAEDVEVFDTDIGRIGALICGENLMTPLRAAIGAMGEDIHVAVFPGAFALHTGPRLEEWDNLGNFWGHFVTRAHAFEAGCFSVCACTFLEPADVAVDFPHRQRMNIGYAKGGSQIVNPLGVVMAGPVEGSKLLYADCPAWMIKAVKAIVDTAGHYSRPDVVRVMLNLKAGWATVGTPYASGSMRELPRSELHRSAEEYEVLTERVEEVADRAGLRIAKSK
ncbi:MAG TPA: carbon-nitrogen hydrolase family protein [Steroidobacteraceae bacterium]|nr:carbon-nitrogen hydrolase family protein [Steroidobacteraceae bacterium]